MNKLLSVILLSFFSLPIFAKQADLDPAKTSFNWLAKKVVGDDKHLGTVSLAPASKIKVGAKGIETGEIIIDMSSINVTDLEGKWKTKFETHMKSEDFFEVEKYPTAKFVIEKVSNGKFIGKMTIKGKTKEVVVPFKKDGNIYSGSLTINRTDFGVIYGSKNFFKKLTLDKAIEDTFSLDFKVALKSS